MCTLINMLSFSKKNKNPLSKTTGSALSYTTRVRSAASDLQRASRDGYWITSLLVHVLTAAKTLEL